MRSEPPSEYKHVKVLFTFSRRFRNEASTEQSFRWCFHSPPRPPVPTEHPSQSHRHAFAHAVPPLRAWNLPPWDSRGASELHTAFEHPASEISRGLPGLQNAYIFWLEWQPPEAVGGTSHFPASNRVAGAERMTPFLLLAELGLAAGSDLAKDKLIRHPDPPRRAGRGRDFRGMLSPFVQAGSQAPPSLGSFWVLRAEPG